MDASTVTAPPSANIELQWVNSQQLAIRPCFSGQGQHVRFELNTDLSGQAGISHSRQLGELELSNEPRCPATNRQSLHGDSQLTVRLRWWLDGQQQPDVIQKIRGDD
jgi:hypothetical protein